MNTVLASAANRYLERVRSLLGDMPDEDRADLLSELESHLILLDELESPTWELSDTGIEGRLGTPDEFVAEFRRSAGLEARRGRSIRRTAQSAAQRAADHPTSRLLRRLARRAGPVWVATRGWLAVSLLALATNPGTISSRFPFPAVGGSWEAGMTLTAIATWVSLRAERTIPRPARWAGRILSAGAGVMVAFIVFDPPVLVESGVIAEIEQSSQWPYPVGLVGGNGEISNIHAFDLDGNPVTVLLYDQSGNPLEVSGEMWFDGSSFSDSYGPVGFDTDAYGQPVTNRYPLTRYGYVYDAVGNAEMFPVPPPRVALPATGDTVVERAPD